MRIRFTRLTSDRHRFEIVRDDGSREAHELETRSTLLHDLAHFAVETEAGLREAFYGRLASGQTYAELMELPPTAPEAMETELVVVQVQNAFRHGDDGVGPTPGEEAQRIAAGFRASESEPPAWLTEDFIARARARMRQLQGQWRATEFRQTLELEFPYGGDRGQLGRQPGR